MTEGEIWYLTLVSVAAGAFILALIYGTSVASRGPK
jgi:hypothetical protein